MKYISISMLLFSLIGSSCCLTAQMAQKQTVKATRNLQQTIATALAEYNLNAVLWQQRSREYRALCYQSFALAKMKLYEKITLHRKDEAPLAIVTDIDETVLDNSPLAASNILHKRDTSVANRQAWTLRSEAGAIPGAVSFLQYADKSGVQCFYISNRTSYERDATIANLLATGFPQADTVHVIMRGTSDDKESRRAAINQHYTIALLIGDNLNDFDSMFYGQPFYTRRNLVRDNSALFGDIFIVLPNPVYGDWESAVWEGKKVTPQQADLLKHQALFEY